MNILIIGSTGFIGKEVVKQLALKEVSLTLLVRNQSKAASLKNLAPSKIEVVTGDLTKTNLGLNPVDKERVLTCDVIIHCGGPMNINLTEEIAKKAFLEGSKNVMDIAKEIHKKHGLKKIVHTVGYMSPFTDNSAAWENIDVFTEIPTSLKGAHPYEQMKFLSDIYIRQEARKNEIPLAVINLPTAIGDEQIGSTAQLGGFGLFIEIIRKGSLPVIPGGEDYRLPLINKNIVAEFIVNTLFNDSKKEMTYSLVSDKEHDHNISELMSIISESMNMNKPFVTAPFGLLKFIMKFGGSKITGIPKSSLSFLTNQVFDNHLTKRDFDAELIKKMAASNIPFSIADIDFRLTYGHEKISPFTRKNIKGLLMYQLEGTQKPIVLVHGLFSDGTDLFELGLELNKQTGREILILDLPGFGRTPFIKNEDILAPYLNVIQSIKKIVPNESVFVGHSFGAALLMKAFKEGVFTNQDKIILLQPPLHKLKSEPTKLISKYLLKHTSYNRLSAYFLKRGFLINQEGASYKYLKRVKNSISSPRILNTTLQLNTALKKMNLDQKLNSQFSIVWGTKDKQYQSPADNGKMKFISSGHYFPISNPVETAEIVLKIIED